MAREPPKCVSPFIFNNTKHSKIKDGLHAFNSIVLDEKIRWYSEELTSAYFQTQQEYVGYVNTIGGKPMDYGTIRKKIDTGEYKKSSDLFQDMELPFTNAMKYNKPSAVWYNEADRLLHIVRSLKKKKVIHGKTEGNLSVVFNPAVDKDEANVRSCTQCNNIMIPKRMSQPKRCGSCSANIKPSQAVYICYNHADKQHEFCKKCVAQFCRSKCKQWHIGKRCPKSKMKSKVQKPSSNPGLKILNLDVPKRSGNASQVKRFEQVKINPIIENKLEKIINIMKKYDPDEHFWNEVTHPEYRTLVKKPIHFGNIVKKLQKKRYSTIKDIKNDIDLLFENCYTFNGAPNLNQPVTSSFANFAGELQWALSEYLEQFNQILCKRGYVADAHHHHPSVSMSPSPPPPPPNSECLLKPAPSPIISVKSLKRKRFDKPTLFTPPRKKQRISSSASTPHEMGNNDDVDQVSLVVFLQHYGLGKFEKSLKDAGLQKVSDLNDLEQEDINSLVEEAQIEGTQKIKFKRAVKDVWTGKYTLNGKYNSDNDDTKKEDDNQDYDLSKSGIN